MKKYTANYSYTNPNFVIQNLVENPIKTDLLPILYVIKNILQRGFPTTLSKYLQSQIGEIHKQSNFNDRFLFATNETPIWYNTIKGDQDRNYYPAKEFFEGINHIKKSTLYLSNYAAEVAYREDTRRMTNGSIFKDLLSRCLMTPPHNEWRGYHQGNKRVAERLIAA